MLIDWIDKKATELGEQLKNRVREGVQDGIKDGVAEVGSEVVKKTKEGAAKSGFGLIEDSMNVWFGAGRKKPSGQDDDDA